MGDSFKARDISIRAQKKLLGKMSNKSVAKTFIDERSASVLDNTYNLAKAYTGDKKEAEKLVKNIIKVVVKIGILARNDQFTADDIKCANKLRTKFSTIVKTIISFYEVDFTYDKNFLVNNITDCRDLLKALVKDHLTDKSVGRIDHVLDFFSNGAFLEEMFRKDSQYRPQMKVIIEDLNKAMDEGEL
ncbi:tumor necrosis factor alpha-induced protein 8-like protein [Hyalella azteca]|uniref:Tumor necrosis factor alpha-induced protein 8-like protein n=1 Tax=Hyalella azteca TaxID=294128 RepID=A0A8B7P9X7_HYAAZ|nr:tumor necrosis factor alpha-induced protein 8-like protein [Hyalella azteca]